MCSSSALLMRLFSPTLAVALAHGFATLSHPASAAPVDTTVGGLSAAQEQEETIRRSTRDNPEPEPLSLEERFPAPILDNILAHLYEQEETTVPASGPRNTTDITGQNANAVPAPGVAKVSNAIPGIAVLSREEAAIQMSRSVVHRLRNYFAHLAQEIRSRDCNIKGRTKHISESDYELDDQLSTIQEVAAHKNNRNKKRQHQQQAAPGRQSKRKRRIAKNRRRAVSEADDSSSTTGTDEDLCDQRREKNLPARPRYSHKQRNTQKKRKHFVGSGSSCSSSTTQTQQCWTKQDQDCAPLTRSKSRKQRYEMLVKFLTRPDSFFASSNLPARGLLGASKFFWKSEEMNKTNSSIKNGNATTTSNTSAEPAPTLLLPALQLFRSLHFRKQLRKHKRILDYNRNSLPRHGFYHCSAVSSFFAGDHLRPEQQEHHRSSAEADEGGSYLKIGSDQDLATLFNVAQSHESNYPLIYFSTTAPEFVRQEICANCPERDAKKRGTVFSERISWSTTETLTETTAPRTATQPFGRRARNRRRNQSEAARAVPAAAAPASSSTYVAVVTPPFHDYLAPSALRLPTYTISIGEGEYAPISGRVPHAAATRRASSSSSTGAPSAFESIQMAARRARRRSRSDRPQVVEVTQTREGGAGGNEPAAPALYQKWDNLHRPGNQLRVFARPATVKNGSIHRILQSWHSRKRHGRIKDYDNRNDADQRTDSEGDESSSDDARCVEEARHAETDQTPIESSLLYKYLFSPPSAAEITSSTASSSGSAATLAQEVMRTVRAPNSHEAAVASLTKGILVFESATVVTKINCDSADCVYQVCHYDPNVHEADSLIRKYSSPP
ncbi:unnamed protein product [Amoebophrya sp. A120]|nr:unnamed protein product [Amoebophrya sp. A120]|eukprot:GSA120T00004079001.1